MNSLRSSAVGKAGRPLGAGDRLQGRNWIAAFALWNCLTTASEHHLLWRGGCWNHPGVVAIRRRVAVGIQCLPVAFQRLAARVFPCRQKRRSHSLGGGTGALPALLRMFARHDRTAGLIDQQAALHDVAGGHSPCLRIWGHPAARDRPVSPGLAMPPEAL